MQEFNFFLQRMHK